MEKEIKKATMLEVVQLYHKKYKEIEEVYNKTKKNPKELQDKIVEMVKEGVDPSSQDFVTAIVNYKKETDTKVREKRNADIRFYYAAYYYNLTHDKDLPEEIEKDFKLSLVPEDMKPYMVVKDGDFHQVEEFDENQVLESSIMAYNNIKQSI